MAEPRTCGGCTACCKTHGIQEIAKAPGQWCPHCKVGESCDIYGSHPPTCQGYQCNWLMGLGQEKDRPDRVKVVCEFQTPPRLGRVLCMFEVEEGGLESEYARTATRMSLIIRTSVVHHPVRGQIKLFLAKDILVGRLTASTENHDGTKTEMKVVPYRPGRF